jgi:hypothetical protein
MIGAEYFGTKAYSVQAAGTNAPTDDIPTVNAATTFVAGDNYSLKSEYRIISTFGRLNYDYDQKYLLSAVFRQDGFPAWRKKTGRIFPGMSAGWNVHREKIL